GKPREFRLDGDTRIEDLRRRGDAAEIFDLFKIEHQPRADEGAPTDMPPDLTFTFQNRHRRAQGSAREPKLPAQFALGRQTIVEGKGMLAEETAQSQQGIEFA